MQRATQLIQTVADAACAIDRSQRIVCWNEPAERLLGYSQADAVGARCFEVFAGSGRTGCALCRCDCEVMRAARSCRPVEAQEMRTRSKDGRVLWLDINVLPVPAGWHETSAIIYLMRNITARVNFQYDLRTLLGHLTTPSGEARQGQASATWMRDLSGREQQVLRALADGLSTTAIAATLHISVATVRNHIRNILSKLGVHNRLEAVVFAHRNALI